MLCVSFSVYISIVYKILDKHRHSGSVCGFLFILRERVGEFVYVSKKKSYALFCFLCR